MGSLRQLVSFPFTMNKKETTEFHSLTSSFDRKSTSSTDLRSAKATTPRNTETPTTPRSPRSSHSLTKNNSAGGKSGFSSLVSTPSGTKLNQSNPFFPLKLPGTQFPMGWDPSKSYPDKALIKFTIDRRTVTYGER